MKVTSDLYKRAATLADRGDFAEATRVFEGPRLTQADNRFDYPEPRDQTYGYLGERIFVVWTAEGADVRVISMRFCHDKEERRIRPRMG